MTELTMFLISWLGAGWKTKVEDGNYNTDDKKSILFYSCINECDEDKYYKVSGKCPECNIEMIDYAENFNDDLEN